MTSPIEPDSRWSRIVRSRIGILLLIVLGLWVIEIVDSVALGDRLQGGGIHPREMDGLDGILWAPLLHSNFGHVASNSVPFVVLGWLVGLRGARHWWLVTLASAIGGGGLIWLLAGGTNHIGASGVVFGYFGALMGAAWRSRRPSTLAPALVAVFLYGTMLVGIVPQAAISWEGHLFGMVCGFAAAYWLVPRRARLTTPDEDDDLPMYPWEIDQPWIGPVEGTPIDRSPDRDRDDDR